MLEDNEAQARQPGATRILVVDDEQLNRQVLVAFLKAGGYDTESAVDGQDAWEILDRDPEAFDVILLDRMMPRLDGMALMARLKADPRLSSVPVIMQTALGSDEEMAEGIAAGVFYYLSKPLDRRLLLSVVQQAISVRTRFARLQEDLERRTTELTLLERGTFRFRTLDEGRILALALARVCPRSQSLVVGLSEIFTNAVEHGNLAIDFEEKARLLAEKRWSQEIEARLDMPEYRDRAVTVEFERRAGEVRFTVRDEGMGFDWQRFVDLDPARAFRAHGRGIVMARRLSFDEVEYRPPGNEVLCVVRDQGERPLPGLMATPKSDGDLQMARAMQNRLLPTPEDIAEASTRYGLSVSALFEPSREVGGDLWGLRPLDDHRLAVWLADFSGHGYAAALNTFRLHTLVRQTGVGRDQPGAYLGQLNRSLSGLLPVGQYATMLYGVLDLTAGEFVYAAAASPSPLAADLLDRTVTVGDGSGLPLGVQENAAYPERSLPLPAGSALLLHSDAVCECPRRGRQKLGSAGVPDLLRRAMERHSAPDVSGILAPFLATVRRPLRDDLTAVCCLRPERRVADRRKARSP
ncbi:MAG: SpoIIE family protein phosphatase [Actinomycetota bacterium]